MSIDFSWRIFMSELIEPISSWKKRRNKERIWKTTWKKYFKVKATVRIWIKKHINTNYNKCKIPEIHWAEFPSVTRCCHSHESDREVRLDYHFLLCNPEYPWSVKHISKPLTRPEETCKWNKYISQEKVENNKSQLRIATSIESNSTFLRLFSTPLAYSLSLAPLDSILATTWANTQRRQRGHHTYVQSNSKATINASFSALKVRSQICK